MPTIQLMMVQLLILLFHTENQGTCRLRFPIQRLNLAQGLFCHSKFPIFRQFVSVFKSPLFIGKIMFKTKRSATAFGCQSFGLCYLQLLAFFENQEKRLDPSPLLGECRKGRTFYAVLYAVGRYLS